MKKVMEILKEKNKLKTDANGNVVVVPTSPYEFRTAPLAEGEAALLISEDAYLGLLLKLYQFDGTLQNIVAFDAAQFGTFMREKLAARRKGA